MTRAHRAQADSQTERQNLVLEDALRVGTFDSREFVNEAGSNFGFDRQEIIEQAQKNLEAAQGRQTEYYDHKRRQVVFKQGDLVLLDTKNFPLKTVDKNTELKKAKLAAKKIGPFVIERMVNDNVAKLILPCSMKRLNPTFNIELLTHYQTNRTDRPNHLIPKAVPLILDDETSTS
ncbi:Retroelement [Phytophthora megakarya]|uniref:Retroelement n=1 Tax=Phytophthora megakarya TaxID=4795 RepID=A0A225WIS1_9STRA|nr:Retroelement [Phytophthora megakarya]